jgi:hypothetical protein
MAALLALAAVLSAQVVYAIQVPCDFGSLAGRHSSDKRPGGIALKAGVTITASGVIVLGAAQLISYLFRPIDLAGALSPDEEKKIKEILKKGGKIEIQNIDEANHLADYLGIRQEADFRALPEQKRLKCLNTVFNDLVKLPPRIREELAYQKEKVCLVLGSVASDPDSIHWDPHPYGRKNGEGWSTVEGVTPEGRVIVAADKVKSLDHEPTPRYVVLHEAAHSYDWTAVTGGEETVFHSVFPLFHNQVSGSPEFQKVWKETDWGLDYFRKDAREAFAESVARYYGSPETNAKMKQEWPLAYEFVQKEFGEPVSFALPSPQLNAAR